MTRNPPNESPSMTERERGRGRVRLGESVETHDAPLDSPDPPSKTLFPDEPVPLSSLQGDWTLIASTATIWQARRDVRMSIGAASSNSQLQATWSFYELGSFKPKTLLTRIAEHRRSGRDRNQKPGENRESQSGIVFEDDQHCFYYTPQKPLPKRIKWEVIGWGDDPTEPEWFLAYIYNQPLISPPFISLYVRASGAEGPDVRALYNDVVDELRNVRLDAQEKSLLMLQYELRRLAWELKFVRGMRG